MVVGVDLAGAAAARGGPAVEVWGHVGKRPGLAQAFFLRPAPDPAGNQY
jgi:hypothetical protein